MKFLLEGENVLKKVRHHWFFVALPIVGLVGLAVLPTILVPFVFSSLSHFNLSPELAAVSVPIVFFTYSLWLLCVWIMMFVAWTNYYLDVWYVTNIRVISIDQKSLFARSISSIRLDMIQDVSMEVSTFIQTFLHVGDITIRTASEHGSFTMENAYDSENLKQFISEESRKAFDKYHLEEFVVLKEKGTGN